MQKYTYELSISELKRLKKDLNEIKELFLDRKFLEYIAENCVKQIKEICATKLSDSAISNDDESSYMQHHKYSVRGNTITLYNDSQIDVASKTWMSDATRSKYKAELSLAKVIEFGIGYTGGTGTYSYVDDDWEYDVNEHGFRGWYYEDASGNKCWTNGFYGKQIYATLMENLDNLIPKWIDEYIKKKL